MVSDIPAGEEEEDILFYSVCTVLFAAVFASVWRLCCCWGVDVSAAAVVSAVAGFTTFADDAIIIPADASVPMLMLLYSIVHGVHFVYSAADVETTVVYVLSVVVLVDSCC